ncbi:MAG: hypothetical protein ACREOG_01515, partial [Gemmatimonadaceae bacterium]
MMRYTALLTLALASTVASAQRRSAPPVRPPTRTTSGTPAAAKPGSAAKAPQFPSSYYWVYV